MKLSLQKYNLIIFDWDGTLVDSISSYKLWDKLYVHKFYNVDLPVEYFEELALDIKTVNIGGFDNRYFRYLDTKYGDGETPIDIIWDNIYSLSPNIQSKIIYQKGAVEVLKLFRANTDAKLALATNAEMRDMRYFSSSDSSTAQQLSPLDFFDTIVTIDYVEKPKPDPETFQKIISRYAVEPSKVLIFEDSLNGVMAGRATGADVVAVFADSVTKGQAHYTINSWGEILTMLTDDVS